MLFNYLFPRLHFVGEPDNKRQKKLGCRSVLKQTYDSNCPCGQIGYLLLHGGQKLAALVVEQALITETQSFAIELEEDLALLVGHIAVCSHADLLLGQNEDHGLLPLDDILWAEHHMLVWGAMRLLWLLIVLHQNRICGEESSLEAASKTRSVQELGATLQVPGSLTC